MRGGVGLYFDRPSGNSIYPQVTNPPSVRNVTVRYGQLQSLGQGGLTTEGPPALAVFEYAGGLPSSRPVELRRADDAAVDDVARRRVRRPARLQHRREHQHQRGGLRRGAASAEPGHDARDQSDSGSTRRSHGSHARDPRLRRDHALDRSRLRDASLAADLVPAALPQRRVIRLQRHDRGLVATAAPPRACSMPPTDRGRTAPIRRRPTTCCRPRRSATR